MKFSILISILIFSTAGCKQTKYSLRNLPDTNITFGSFGGFSGALTEYTLLENGQLFEYISLPEKTTELKTVKARKVKSIYKLIAKCDFKNTKLNEPGNMSYFISLKNKDSIKKLVWGKNGSKVPESINELYTELNRLIIHQNED